MTPGKTPFNRAVHAQQTSAFIQRQVQSLRALTPTVVLPFFSVVLPCSRCSREGKRAFEKPILRLASAAAAKRYVVRAGVLTALPTTPGAFLTTGLLSLAAKLALLREP